MAALLLFVWFGSLMAGIMIDNLRGAILGALIGPLGVLVAYFMATQDKRHKETLEALGAAGYRA